MVGPLTVSSGDVAVQLPATAPTRRYGVHLFRPLRERLAIRLALFSGGQEE